MPNNNKMHYGEYSFLRKMTETIPLDALADQAKKMNKLFKVIDETPKAGESTKSSVPGNPEGSIASPKG
jgi:hypothetical protein